MFRSKQRPATATNTYATIIIPTHDRAATLGYSIQSATEQTVDDLEIIVVGDGCSDECRSIAQSWQARDHRVRLLDLPKAPFRGVANRDRAVREARTEYVFYNDDDDLLLPRHVETLGRQLEEADVVDTPVVSVGSSRRIDLGVHDSSHPIQRRLLAEGKVKMVFDTHLAHRKSTYLRLGGAWLRGTDRRAVLHMLGALAADHNVRWTTLPRITALSFHGKRRVTMSAEDREEEIGSWASRLQESGLEQHVREVGTYSFHCFQNAKGLVAASMTQDEVWRLLSRLLHCASGSMNPSPRHRSSVVGAFALATGRPMNEADARVVFNDLLDARLGPYLPAVHVVPEFRKRFSSEVLLNFIDADSQEPHIVAARFALSLTAGAGDDRIHSEAVQAFRSAPSESQFFLAVAFAQSLRRVKRLKEAWAWTERALPHAPYSHLAVPFWKLRAELASLMGLESEASVAGHNVAQCAELMT